MSSPQDFAKSDSAAEASGHDEWLVDEAIRQTFPASDPVAVSQPGSLVYQRNASIARRWRPRKQDRTTFWWLMAGCAIFFAGFHAGRRRR